MQPKILAILPASHPAIRLQIGERPVITELDRLEANQGRNRMVRTFPAGRSPPLPYGAIVPLMPAELLTRWTIRVALALYVLAVSGRLWALARYGSGPAEQQGGDAERSWWVATRLLWTAACLVFLLHLACAMHFYHGWSNQAAVEDTARQTEALFGWRFGEGIYFSYAFAVIWAVDVVWCWVAPRTYRQRANWLSGLLHAYLFFIAFNGAVVFESGPTRPAGLAATVLLACLLIGGIIVRRMRSANGPASVGPTSVAPASPTGRRSDCR